MRPEFFGGNEGGGLFGNCEADDRGDYRKLKDFRDIRENRGGCRISVWD